jgi:hypothetical protein
MFNKVSFFFRKSCYFRDNVEKYCTAGHATHAQCMLDSYGYKYTLRISNTFPLEQWLHERASVLHYTYSTLPVLFNDTVGNASTGF